MSPDEWDGQDPRVGVVVSAAYARKVLEAADRLEKAAEAVVVNETPTAGDEAGTDPYSLLHRDLLADLDSARDNYREVKADA